MSELGVHRAGDHLRVDRMELVHAVAEGDDLGGADERAAKDPTADSRPQEHIWHPKCTPEMYSQVQRVKEEDQIFPFVVRQLQLLEFTVDDSGSLPVWRRLGNCRQTRTVLQLYI